ncbi:hypothetical protein SPIROBIBN47_180020 [uncultured spirochete]|uniref:Uncharacterized protein n=1 Tax=uncultured spirochete TaxID=156406 RepID=A0A3P3XGI2_9SPIR|nr:hypothetical protein SPIROBIBN47_180020 [uncultured spirochete]
MEFGLFASIRWTQRIRDSSLLVIRLLSTIDEFHYSQGLGMLEDGMYIFDADKTVQDEFRVELDVPVENEYTFG